MKMATSPQIGQQYPQASQFSYMNMLQSGMNANQPGHTTNNGISGIPNCMSIPLFPQVQVQPPMQNSPLSNPLPCPDILNKIFSRLECIDSKLQRLDKIEKSVSDIYTKVETLESKMVCIEQSRQFDSQTMNKISTKQSQMQKDLDDIKKT